jgi:hypothetical protein
MLWAAASILLNRSMALISGPEYGDRGTVGREEGQIEVGSVRGRQ